MERQKKYSISELAKLTGFSESAIIAMGRNSVLNQYLAGGFGINAAIHCEDSRMADQDTGDAEKDLNYLLNGPMDQ